VYPPESFKQVQHYGLTLMITTEEGLKDYLNNVLSQLESNSQLKLTLGWLMKKMVQKLVLVLTDVDTNEVLERWAFNIETDDNVDEKTFNI
jgi:mitotic spindle assembly checkpoint protein MAD2